MPRSPRWLVRLIPILALAAVAGCSDDGTVQPPPLQPAVPPRFDLGSEFNVFAFPALSLDDAGANDTPAQTDLNGFTRADNVAGKLAVKWTWDDTDSWTGTGQTGDACALFDTNGDGWVDYAVCVRITNAPDGSVVQLPAGQSPQIYSCKGRKTDRCAQSSDPLPLGGTICQVTTDPEGFPGEGEDGADVLAGCIINLSSIGNATNTNLVNVCSFPSGSPNSNPFDCVVTPGSGFIQIRKLTTPDQSAELFEWTMTPATTDGESEFGLVDSHAGAEMTALLPVPPGTFSITEKPAPAGWQLSAASCLRESTPTGTKSGSTVSGIGVTIGETTVCTFTNIIGAPTIDVTKTANPTSVAETGGDVTYTVDVTNTSVLAVTLTSLVDDKFGDLNGQGTCLTGGSIAADATYSCSFTKTLGAATAGATHVNTVTGQASNDGGTATDSDDATVTYADVAPTVEVTKSANVASVPETGGDVTYTVEVKNTSAETVTLTALTDDKFGNLNGQGTCATGGSIAAGATYSCSFTKTISGNVGTSHTNIATAEVADDDGSTVTDFDDAVVSFTDVAPDITVVKTASPTHVPETGGDVAYTVLVTNDVDEPLTLLSLQDDLFGDLDGVGTCNVPVSIPVDGSYSCTFTKPVAGNVGTEHTNTVTATATDDDGSEATDSDDATVTFDDVAPTIEVTKTPDKASVPETGGAVQYTVGVKNTSQESVTLTSLSDDVFGDLAGKGTCATGGTIAAGATYSCAFTETISGMAGNTHDNTVTANAVDDEGTGATGSDDASVLFDNVDPVIVVSKTPSVASVPETGGDVTYTVSVLNDGPESVELTSLQDDAFGDLNGVGTCSVPQTIAVDGTYSCTFTKTLSGNADESHTNIVTGTAEDDDGTEVTDSDDATVTFTDVLPDISVTKTADPTSLSYTPGSGGLGDFTPDRTFTTDPNPPAPGSFQFASPTCDDAGANDVPAQTDLNCFNRADNVATKLGVKWTWDDTDSWTGTGQTGDACALLDTDNDGNANVAVCARITNTPDGLQVVQVGGPGVADVYICNDRQPDRCAKQVTKLTDVGTTTCTIAIATEAFPGVGDDGADVEATCSISLTMQGLAGAASVDLLNVCSFPSGEPNSNPFDCVVRAGAGFIQIVKSVTPSTTELFGFTLSPASTDGTSKYAVQGGVTSAMIPVLPGSNFSLTETLPSGWTLTGATCSVDGQSTGTFSQATAGVSAILVKTGQTTVCTFNNTALITGDVTYTIVVTNHSLEIVSLFSLVDDKFGGLNGVGTCATGGSIAGDGGTYTCSFTKTLSGAPGTSHINEVTAVGNDDEGNSDQAKATATVSFVSS